MTGAIHLREDFEAWKRSMSDGYDAWDAALWATERAAKAELEACESIAISWSDKSVEAEQIAAEIRERAAAIRNGGAG